MKKTPLILIEDNPGDVKLFEEALLISGIRRDLTVFRNAEEAMSYLIDQMNARTLSETQIIFLDLNLPRKTGLEFLEEIQRFRASRQFSIIVLTSTIILNEIDRAYSLGATCVIRKPFNVEDYMKDLGNAIKFWVDIQQ